MIPTIVTVPSLWFWEEDLVQEVRSTGLARIVDRVASRSALLESDAEVVVIGDTAPFLSAGLLRRLASDRVVIGVVTGPGTIASQMFVEAGVAAVFRGSVPADAVVAVALEWRARNRGVDPKSKVVVVRGVRGAPGCTEIAIGLAAALGRHHRCLLVEGDRMAPSIGLRLGLPPGSSIQSAGDFDVCAPFGASGPSTNASIARIIDRSAATHRFTVVDQGIDGRMWGDHEFLVVQASPTSVVRAARAVSAEGTPVVANRVRDSSDLAMVRSAIGGDPVAVVPDVEVTLGCGAVDEIVMALAPLADLMSDDQRATAR